MGKIQTVCVILDEMETVKMPKGYGVFGTLILDMNKNKGFIMGAPIRELRKLKQSEMIGVLLETIRDELLHYWK